MTEFKIRPWANQCRLFQPEEITRFKVVRDAADLRAFAETCHELVTDRDQSFTLADRIKLYRRWLASGAPCLLAAHDGGHVVGTSIILPLTLAACREFWDEGLDALDVGVEHLIRPNDPEPNHVFLIDILASNNDYIRRMPHASQHAFHGIGFRTMVYHLSLFFADAQPFAPVIVCSSFNRQFAKLFGAMGFQRRARSGEAPIFCGDFAARDRLSDDALWLLDGMAGVIQGYVRARTQQTQGTGAG
jgi:hypothetical protein